MITDYVTSDLPTVTPTMAEDLTDQHLHEWHTAYCRDRIYVTMFASMLGYDRADEITRIADSLHRIHEEISTRRDQVIVVAEAYAILQGVS